MSFTVCLWRLCRGFVEEGVTTGDFTLLHDLVLESFTSPVHDLSDRMTRAVHSATNFLMYLIYKV